MSYPAVVLARFDAPSHAGSVVAGPGQVVTGRAGSVATGAQVTVEVRVDQQRIAAAAFRAWGCPYTIAACDLLAEQLTGRGVEALRDFDLLALAARLELPAARRGRLLCIEDALRSCWRAWDNKRLSASSVSRSDP